MMRTTAATTTKTRRITYMLFHRWMVLLLFLLFLLFQSSSLIFVEGVRKNVHIASPLQSLTLWDHDLQQEMKTRRELFLQKYKIGLQAEVDARKQVYEPNDEIPAVVDNINMYDKVNLKKKKNNKNWANQVAALDRKKFYSNEKLIERAYDQAIQQVEQEMKQRQKQKEFVLKNNKKNQHQQQQKYQFVGVINDNNANNARKDKKPPITWYTRKKPYNSKWTIRLIHVNKNAILYDLFQQGKIDIFGKYTNTGQFVSSALNPKDNTNEDTTTTTSSSSSSSTNYHSKQPIIHSQYTIRQKSWKNLWNFSFKHMITDSSGMYWRERRLQPGLYTDGNTVYEASYRYRDGRNGMHRISSLQQFLSSRNIDTKTKQSIVNKLKSNAPDIVLEE